ncbi:MAG: ATP-binding protein, partial [Thermomicrobiales bacterium]
MRDLFIQFLAPVVVLLSGLAAGELAGTAGWGSVVGGALAVLVAVGFSHRTAGRLTRLERVARRDSGVDPTAESIREVHGRIDHALQMVAQQVVKDDRERQVVSQLLMTQTQVLDRMNDGLMRVAGDGQVTYANVAAGSLFGGRNPTGRTFMSVTRDHELYRALRDCLDSGDDRQHTFEIAGEGRLVNAVAIRLSERPPEALVMLRDITEVNRLQNLRRDFVSNVSHELRTPLSTIKILAETLLEIRGDDAEAAEYLRKIDGEVDSMAALVRDLLELTRLETMGGRLALREIDAGLLAQDVRSRMKPLAERHDVSLAVETTDAVGTVVGDERRLHQALINLITNAIVHTQPGGTVTVGASRDVGGVRFFVRDTGAGIPPEDLPRIWERFFKADRRLRQILTNLLSNAVKFTER